MIPLFCRITVDGQEVRFGMKCDVNPKFWDVKAGKAGGRTTEAVKINSLIENTKAAIFKIYRDLQERDNYVTAETVRNVFLGATTGQQTLLQLCDRHNRERKPLIGVSICAWQHGSYIRARNHLADFLHRWYNVSDIPVRDVDHKFIRNFEAYLTENYRYAHNTLTHYLQNLWHIIHLAIDAEYITKNPFANFRLQVKCPDRAFLTQEEVERMITTHIENEKIEQARDIFLFCCYTGLSYSDVFGLTSRQIQQSFNGKLWIKGKRQKTDIEYNIPLLNIPQLILDKYSKNRQSEKVLPVPGMVTYNLRLKKVAKACGIDKNISSHLARHTFATTVALTGGVPIETVSKMPGHTGIKTTQIYAKVINSKIGSDMDMLAEKLSGMEAKMTVNF
ncbi:MAG: site-specific integrase [Prevotellaceae bacterium]|jgi:site-specific recombinase XerD|nr:site-specific integrase [Prevotellaceae bacterium]